MVLRRKTVDINLTELQKTMDQQGLELVENQKESVVGRKALADRTKGAPRARACRGTADGRAQTSRRYPRRRSRTRSRAS